MFHGAWINGGKLALYWAGGREFISRVGSILADKKEDLSLV